MPSTPQAFRLQAFFDFRIHEAKNEHRLAGLSWSASDPVSLQSRPPWLGLGEVVPVSK
jgi:hypothetical protein